ncbi:MAG: hypothetical protein DRN06_08930, partial [Thermoprotei archaeon]
AHDIIAAKLALKTGLPFVYDDHEYWSKEAKYRMCYLRSPLQAYGWLIWRKWEKEVLRKAAGVVTICDNTANEHRAYNDKVIVLPNLPLREEVEEIEEQNKPKTLSTVYVGSLSQPQPPYRDMSGFMELFKENRIGNLVVIGDEKLKSEPPIYSLGVMPHRKLLRELAKYHIGIIPWKKHPFHRYCNPNKAYEYAAAGLHVIVPSDMDAVISMFNKLCETFEDYNDMVSMLSYYAEDPEEALKKGLKIKEYAKQHLVWENYADRLIGLYRSL